MQQQRPPDFAFVVVAVLGLNDISETTWPTAADAQRQRERLLKLGLPAARVRVYRTRVVKPVHP
ncbi:MAG TPA: hypothetical protein VFT91_07195 [Dehalococcoidia bacterium]|nr:hypothetical protein [Dehalococcoidia bacterium]